MAKTATPEQQREREKARREAIAWHRALRAKQKATGMTWRWSGRYETDRPSAEDVADICPRCGDPKLSYSAPTCRQCEGHPVPPREPIDPQILAAVRAAFRDNQETP